ncbi:hypothetical protein MSG28_015903, partial [Choristoneura fumiferana]
MTELKPLTTLNCKQQVVRAVRFNVDGTYCLTCGADKKIKLWNPQRQLLLKTYGGHANEVLDAAGSCDSSQIISCSADKSVILWDVTTGQPLRRYRGHASSVTRVKYNEESTMAISGSVDNTVAFWDVLSRRQEPVQVLKDAKDTITSIQITDYEVVTCSVDSHVRRYDLRVGKMVSDFIGHIITFGSLTHDGQCYILSCADSSVKLFDKDSGELLNTFTGHESKDYLLENAVNAKDSHIISGSATGEVFFWDLISSKVTSKLVHKLNKPIVSLSHHPTEDYLLTACEDEVILWDEAMRKRWTDATKIEKRVTQDMQVCSRHFVKNDYILSGKTTVTPPKMETVKTKDPNDTDESMENGEETKGDDSIEAGKLKTEDELDRKPNKDGESKEKVENEDDKDTVKMASRAPTRLRERKSVLKCELCGRKCLTPQALRTHQQTAHKSVKNDEIYPKKDIKVMNKPREPLKRATIPQVAVKQPDKLCSPKPPAKKYSIASLMNITASQLPDSEGEDSAEPDLYLQFNKVVNLLITEAARINISGLKKLMRKALEMMTIVNSYVEDEDDVVSTKLSISPVPDKIHEEVKNALKNFKAGSKRKSDDVEIPAKKKKLLRSTENTLKVQGKIKSHTDNNREEVENLDSKATKGYVTPNKEKLKNNQQSPSFIDTYQQFVGKIVKPVEKKKPEKKKQIVKTKMGQFKPSPTKKLSMSPKVESPSRTSIGSVKEIKYEVKEQEND